MGTGLQPADQTPDPYLRAAYWETVVNCWFTTGAPDRNRTGILGFADRHLAFRCTGACESFGGGGEVRTPVNWVKASCLCHLGYTATIFGEDSRDRTDGHLIKSQVL